jgi:hypothetical protein
MTESLMTLSPYFPFWTQGATLKVTDKVTIEERAIIARSDCGPRSNS